MSRSGREHGNNLSKIKTPERILILIFSLAFFVLFTNATRINSLTQQLDQAYFLESIDNTYETGRSTTMLTRSVIRAIQDLIVAPVSKICEYQFESDGREKMNIYERHSFPILYGLAALRTLFPTRIIYYLCALFAFPGLLLLIYLRSRVVGVPAFVSIVLVLMVAVHPAWSYASFGQFYPDKLFPMLCVVYFLLLHDWMILDRRRPFALLMVGIIAASTSERSTIMLVAGTLAVYVFFGLRRRWSRLDILPLVLVAVMTAYVYIYMHFIQHDPDYASFLSGSLNFFSLMNGETAKAIYKFLLINVLLLVPFAIFAKRWALIALCSMVPNLVGSIGGAEKLGWTTHYHSYYFPFLIIALIMGASSLFQKPSRRLVTIALTLVIGVTLFYALLDPFSPPSLRFSLKQVRETGVAKAVEFTTASGPAAAIIIRSEYLKDIAAFVPAGSEVSTSENYMPALYDHGVKLIHFYPLGLGKSGYVVVRYSQEHNVLRWEGFVSYLGPEVIEQANTCLQNRLNEQYILVKAFPDSPLTGTAILQRK